MGLQDLLVPDFGLGAGVGEDQRALVSADDVHHLIQQLDPEVTGPSQFLKGFRHEAVHGNALLEVGPDNAGPRHPIGADEGLHRLP